MYFRFPIYSIELCIIIPLSSFPPPLIADARNLQASRGGSLLFRHFVPWFRRLARIILLWLSGWLRGFLRRILYLIRHHAGNEAHIGSAWMRSHFILLFSSVLLIMNNSHQRQEMNKPYVNYSSDSELGMRDRVCAKRERYHNNANGLSGFGCLF